MKGIFLLFLIAAGGIGWFFYNEHSTAQKTINNLERTLPSLEESAAQKRTELQAYGRIRQAEQKLQAGQKDIAAVKTRSDELASKTALLKKEKAEIVQRARAAVSGKVLPQLQLKDGRQLLQVSINKADENGLSVNLPTGVQKIPANDLPEDLKKSLYY